MVFLITLGVNAHSSTRVGNGGFAILCKNKIELLDTYQARENGKKVSTLPGSNLDEKIYFLLSKLEGVDPNRAKSYRFLYERDLRGQLSFLTIDGLRLNSSQVADKELQKQFGLGNISIPTDCELLLVAQQANNEYVVTLKIYQSSWNLLALDDQASLILHELFYREAMRRNLNSAPVRALNGLLATDEFNLLKTNDWSDILKKENFIVMFPEFYNSAKTLDIENTSPARKNPELENYSFEADINFRVPWFSGQFNFCNNSYNITTRSNLFFNGITPKAFIITDTKTIDFSCLGKHNLKIHNNESFLISLRRSIDVETNRLSVRIDGTSQGYLFEFTHPQVSFSGPILVQIDGNSIRLVRTDFSILQVNENGKWQNASSLDIDLVSGKIK